MGEAELVAGLTEALNAGGNVVVLALAYAWWKLDKRLSAMEIKLEHIEKAVDGNNTAN